MKIAGAGSGSEYICQRYGSADPDADSDPYQNVMDPQHCHIYLPAAMEELGDKCEDVFA
jgi:hypothetical protein